MRLVLADDAWLAREGLARLLAAHGHTVVGTAGHPDDVPALVRETAPDIVILDIRMPPAFTDEGLRLAGSLRRDHPDLPLLLLSQYAEPAYVTALLELTGSRHCGYLLKEHVLDARQLDTALERLAAGEVVIDTAVVRLLLDSAGLRDPLASLTRRERDVLALMAQGLTDRGISERLFVSLNTVGTHVQRVLRKLDIPSGAGDNRRVLAVLAYLDHTPPR
ncbi:response regulator transcription factor [Streptosporangium roseum]|uniref:response regulator transcription factor n=1 Tax=Streptosporangium roseum TaxID=2001 RepID=UPI0033180131